ncbi:MAG: hypothetical protein QM638_00435 [Nocardioides sp.]|uniref:hypothetical protein n=1 Tax=Nocardioides sp. TaxID=35761 RepID=UPI0039E36F2F
MRGRFRLTPGGSYPHEPWFRLGGLEVTTSWVVVGLTFVGLMVFAAAGGLWTYTNLALVPTSDMFYAGKAWTLLTWPFITVTSNDVFWTVLTMFFFWYFGSDLERSELGKRKFAAMLTVWTIVLGGLLLAVTAATGLADALYGLNMLELMVLLLWIAEWPDRMFFFSIPAWVLGLILAGVQVIQYLGDRRWTMLLVFLLGAVVCGFVARQFGMLSRYHWLPKLSSPRGHAGRPRRARRRRFDADRPTVVPGPWQMQDVTPERFIEAAQSRDEQRMDELLDKISAGGTESLSEAERAELLELRARRHKKSRG